MVAQISVFPPISAAGVSAGATATLPTVAIGGAFIPGAALGLLPTILQARGGPFAPKKERFPQIKPGDLLKAALAIQALSERGLQPVSSIDPFTGNLVVSTADQSGVLTTILGEKFAREALAPTREELDELSIVRQQVVDSFASPTARVAAPGVVTRGRQAQPRRLGGPCAGVTTGFSRLNCARGGIS